MKSRKPNRLPGYDYSHDGCYFFTGVVQGRLCCLGEVRAGVMHLNSFGKVAQERWFWLAEQDPCVRLHAFVVMPSHVHGILEIDRSMIDPPSAGTGRDPSLHEADHGSIQIKSLPELKGACKTTVSKHIHLAGLLEFGWQRSFHDRIIRDRAGFERISRYMHDNPANWKDDDLYSAPCPPSSLPPTQFGMARKPNHFSYLHNQKKTLWET
ncbi:MAG: hypothetical protein NW241_11020 [Bacteroidia bacterium]|nr:hypothetical protein [Bacteroidia bacterium]